MPKPNRDYTQVPGNPAHYFKQHLEDIEHDMKMSPELGKARILGVLDRYAEHGGMARENAERVKMDIEKAYETGNWGGIRNDPAMAMLQRIYNFVLGAIDRNLSASAGIPGKMGRQPKGLQVNPHEARIRTMANLMLDDANDGYPLCRDTREIVEMAIRHGFVVEVNITEE